MASSRTADWLFDTLRAFAARSLAWRVAVVGAVSAALMVGDVLTGADVGFMALYVAPVALAAWSVGRGAALGLAVVTTAATAVTDMHVGEDPRVLAWNLGMQVLALWALAALVVELREALLAERRRAETDLLTGLHSRAAFLAAAQHELARARRFNRPMTLVYIDLDDFKLVNDTLGHGAGDRVLQRVGATFKNELRALDLAGRLGGDEFALVLPELSHADAVATVQRLKLRLAAATAGLDVSLGFSFGLASVPAEDGDLDRLIRVADERMYSDKGARKHRPRARRAVPSAQLLRSLSNE